MEKRRNGETVGGKREQGGSERKVEVWGTQRQTDREK